MVDDAVRIERAALDHRARRGGVFDLDALVLARGGDQRSEVGRDGGIGLGDDRAVDEALGLARVTAERGQQLLLGTLHRSVERGDTALAQRADPEQQCRALGGSETERPGEAVREVHEHAPLVDGDQ